MKTYIIEKVWLFIDQNNNFLGASPDGIIFENDK